MAYSGFLFHKKYAYMRPSLTLIQCDFVDSVEHNPMTPLVPQTRCDLCGLTLLNWRDFLQGR
jgi:hypothetical protein